MNQREKELYLREYATLKAQGKPFFPYAVAKDGLMACVVVGVKPQAAVTEKEPVELCSVHLGNYKRPGKVVLRHDPLPKTPVGKIKRKELREPFWVGHERRVAAN